jgi:hypothetical protein
MGIGRDRSDQDGPAHADRSAREGRPTDQTPVYKIMARVASHHSPDRVHKYPMKTIRDYIDILEAAVEPVEDHERAKHEFGAEYHRSQGGAFHKALADYHGSMGQTELSPAQHQAAYSTHQNETNRAGDEDAARMHKRLAWHHQGEIERRGGRV